jgi:DNA-binding CsgD family transcriptional regulator
MEDSVFTYFNSLGEHEHICHLYYEDAECFEIATSFILNAIKSGEKCAYLSDRPAPKDLISRLRGHGIVKFGHGKDKIFEELIISNPVKESKKAQALVCKIENKIDGALGNYNKPLRVLMMHSDNCYFLANSDRLWKRAKLDRICLNKSIILLNQFNVDRLNSKDILSIFKTHPVIVERDKVYRSPLYIAPESIIKDMKKESEKFKSLSGKEKKVLRLIINGLSNSRIANELSISVKTVETHRANMMKKLEIHNLVDLVKFSMRNGIA